MTARASKVQRDRHTIAHRDDLRQGGNWTLVRRSLGCRLFGVNLVDIPSGESIPNTMKHRSPRKRCSA
jgi:hypothetical protein